MSAALKQYLLPRGISTSRSTPNQPQENSQNKSINQTAWCTVKNFMFHDKACLNRRGGPSFQRLCIP